MCGFKSFADRTKLVFEPGLIAIVGPNGCGKSNVSDAIRWVLGEQRPSALRGAKMMDVVFNGTDARKPMSMAEVSITFAECEQALGTDFNEVTVTRRVFRTGDSGYYINKAPCRLKDIQRLFMGTGIGTTSYSIMAQGQIDAILSSRPEDRRTIFEEAAGITKYKADRKEAMRKLEQTEANLLRLADVIREVKRQIGTLQRQAGKAQKFRQIKSELRSYDLFAARKHVAAFDQRLREIEQEIANFSEREQNGLTALQGTEEKTAAIRSAINENEEKINEATAAAAQDESNLDHAKEIIQIGEQRIEEYRNWAERDSREATQIRAQLEELASKLESLHDRESILESTVEGAKEARETLEIRMEEEKRVLDQKRHELADKHGESMERERRSAYLQNHLAEMEEQHRSAVAQRERLAGEHGKLTADLEQLTKNRDDASQKLEELRARAETAATSYEAMQDNLQDSRDELQTAKEEVARLTTQMAALRAKIDLLEEQEARAESFQSGSRKLLDASNPLSLPNGVVVGPLAEVFKTSAEYRPALEAVLRAWIDAVVIRDATDVPDVLRHLLATGSASAARMVAATGVNRPNKTVPPPAGLSPLVNHVEIRADFREAGEALLQNVFIASTLDDVPAVLPADCVIVTLGGAVLRSEGLYELWMPEGASSTPLARRMAINDGNEQLAAAEQRLSSLKANVEELSARTDTLSNSLSQARHDLDEARRVVAQKEGEFFSIKRDADRATERIEIVASEMEMATEQNRAADEEKTDLTNELQELLAGRDDFFDAIAKMQDELEDSEADFNDRNQEFTEARLLEANRTQEWNQTTSQIEIFEGRRVELTHSLEGRTMGLHGYDESIAKLTEQITHTRDGLVPMQEKAERSKVELENWKMVRAEKNQELERTEAILAATRQGLDAIRGKINQFNVEKGETTIRRQNLFDRVMADYQLSPSQLAVEPDPDWGPAGEPALDLIEKKVAEFNAAIDALGPVNLVAIEECKELEERYALEKAQEEDLVNSKEQIEDLLRKINEKSAELFAETFQQANENFGKMFAKLFNGGTAKLVQIENPEDPLECGVEIIARPPGKRLQSISLLSGGERTMTAVSLLFAIYQIKPSPFCLLDELDAALDDSNIGRFVQTLKDFLVQSQFLVITHNQHSIANSSIVYGVTMPEKGVSKVISMRLPDMGVRDLELIDRPVLPTEPEIPLKKSRKRSKRTATDNNGPQQTATDADGE